MVPGTQPDVDGAMAKHTTIPDQDRRHALDRRRLVLGALERHQWRLLPTAAALEVTEGWLRRYVEAEPVIGPLYAERKPGRGQPRKHPA